MALAAEHQSLIVSDGNEALMGLSLYSMRGVNTLDPGTTLELREPSLHRIAVTKSWETPPDGAATPLAGFHLLRIEQPATQLRVNGRADRVYAKGRR